DLGGRISDLRMQAEIGPPWSVALLRHAKHRPPRRSWPRPGARGGLLYKEKENVSRGRRPGRRGRPGWRRGRSATARTRQSRAGPWAPPPGFDEFELWQT